MSQNYIVDLIDAVRRVTTPDTVLLREVLILGGMPEKTENLRYLSFNRQAHTQSDLILEFSAVAVLNNRRIGEWRLTGRRRRISQIVFSTRWTRNPLDLFLNNIRCDDILMNLVAGVAAPYSLLGLLQSDNVHQKGPRRIRPVIAIPTLSETEISLIESFEKNNEVSKSLLMGVLVYRKSHR